jgi:hypothetical protein
MDALHIPNATWDQLQEYLDHPVERMAFLAAIPVVGQPEPEGDQVAGAWRVVDVMYLDDENDYSYQGWAGVELADDIRPRTLKWATGHGAALVEVHSHGVGWRPTTFSTTDLRGLVEAVPTFVWRLGGRPYAAIVVGGRKDHDSLTWAERDSAPTPIGELVVGGAPLTPTQLAVTRIDNLENEL